MHRYCAGQAHFLLADCLQLIQKLKVAAAPSIPNDIPNKEEDS
jgi:hypothetical protein